MSRNRLPGEESDRVIVLDAAWLEDTTRRAVGSLRAHMVNKPYVTLGAMVGTGLVVGAGLFRPVARSVVGLGARLALSTVVPALVDHYQLGPRAPQPTPDLTSS